jgi:hypothetical protein
MESIHGLLKRFTNTGSELKHSVYDKIQIGNHHKFPRPAEIAVLDGGGS